MSQIPTSVESFQLTLKSLQFQQRFLQWQNCIQSLETSNSPQLEEFYGAFCEDFPYNYRTWNKYAQYVAKKTNLQEGVKIFDHSVTLNTWSVELWNCYCYWVKTTFSASDPHIVKQTYARAVDAIGFDYYSGTFWEELLNYSQSNPVETFKLYARLVAVPFNKLADLFQKFTTYLGTLTQQQLVEVYKSQKNQDYTGEDIAQALLNELRPVYESTNALVQEKLQHEQNLKSSEYETQALQDVEFWKKYLRWESERGTPASVRFLLQKCLISQSNQSDFWLRYFDLLTANEALQFIEARKKFFAMLPDVVYYWSELLEATNPDRAVLILIEQQERQLNQLAPYLRHIEIENRRKNFSKVDEIFATLYQKFTGNFEAKAYLVSEQARVMAQAREDGLAAAVRVFQQHLHNNSYTKQVFAYLLEFFSKFYQTRPNAVEKFKEVILGTLQAAKDDNKISRELVLLTRNYLRTDFATDSAAQAELEKKLRDINLTLSTAFLSNTVPRRPDSQDLSKSAKRKAEEQPTSEGDEAGTTSVKKVKADDENGNGNGNQDENNNNNNDQIEQEPQEN